MSVEIKMFERSWGRGECLAKSGESTEVSQAGSEVATPLKSHVTSSLAYIYREPLRKGIHLNLMGTLIRSKGVGRSIARGFSKHLPNIAIGIPRPEVVSGKGFRDS